MSARYPGGVVRKSQLVSASNGASGIWTIGQAAQATKSGNWPYANLSYPISNSLRFRSESSTYLNRTGTSSTSRTWTWSGWVKRGSKFFSGYPTMFTGYNGDESYATQLFFSNDGTLQLYNVVGGTLGNGGYAVTAAKFRDPAAWYHVVYAVDTTQSTAAAAFKIYVNGVQQTLGSSGYGGGTNQNTYTNYAQRVGLGAPPNTDYYDGYIAEAYYIDGQALTPSYFGSTNAVTGQWQPIEYKGTYGTNGHRLKFDTANYGADTSGNNNTFTVNNFSTSGATKDQMVDVPTSWQVSGVTDIGGVVRGNYCTLNPAIRQYSSNDSTGSSQPSEYWADGNLRVYFKHDGVGGGVFGTLAIPNTGKWYFEYTNVYEPANAPVRYGQWVGIAPLEYVGAYNGTYGGSSFDLGYVYGSEGNINTSYVQGGTQSGVDYKTTYGTGDVIGVAYDADAATVAFYKNNTLIHTITGVVSQPLGYVPMVGGIKQNTGSGWNTSNIPAQGLFNFGATPFIYSPPSGYKSICTTNIVETTTIGNSQSAATAPNRYFDVITYTGNGSTNAITGLNFAPDFLWIKNRGVTSNWPMHDTIRGAGQQIISNSNGDEVPGGTELASFNSDGFTVSGTAGSYNTSTNTYVAYAWNAGGANTTNTSGTTTSIVRANPTSGFSVITYTGTGSAGATVGHGLGAAPKMLIIKGRNTGTSGIVWHSSYDTNQGQMLLDSTAAIYNPSNGLYFNSTTPGSSVVTLGTSGATNGSAQTYVMYAWAEIRGFSKFGKWTGNGNASGPYIHCGFKPKFIIYKRSDSTGSWFMVDSVRQPINPNNLWLQANTNEVEQTDGAIDFLSNGFRIGGTGTGTNADGGTYIYMAFADTPFKNAIAR